MGKVKLPTTAVEIQRTAGGLESGPKGVDEGGIAAGRLDNEGRGKCGGGSGREEEFCGSGGRTGTEVDARRGVEVLEPDSVGLEAGG